MTSPGTHYDVPWAVAQIQSHPRTKFLFFWGHTPRRPGEVDASALSQWYPAPFKIDGTHYPTAEHWMMAEKARLFGDDTRHTEILQSPTPGHAKALGREVLGFDQQVWDTACFDIVRRGNLAKFGQHPDLLAYLATTGTKILAEASPHDWLWGIGLAKDHDHARHPDLWPGQNLLGFALMNVRDTLLAL